MSKEKEEVDYGTLGFEVDDTALPLREVPKEEEKPARRKPKASQEVRNIEEDGDEDGDEQLISCGEVRGGKPEFRSYEPK